MAAPPLSLYILLLFFIAHIPQSLSQQNIETFYPFNPPPPLPFTPPPPPPPSDAPTFLPPPSPVIPPPRGTSTKAAVGKAIGVTAASTVVLSGLLLFLLLRYSKRKREKDAAAAGGGGGGAVNGRSSAVAPQAQNSFTRYGGNVKGLIVDENGLDVLYWRNMQEGENRSSFKKHYKSLREEQKEEEKRIVSERERERRSKPPVQELPLLRGKSSTSQSLIWAAEKDDQIIEKAPSFSNGVAPKVEKEVSSIQLMQNLAPPLPPPPGTPWLQPSRISAAVAQEKSPPPPPPPPPPMVPVPAAAPPPPPPPVPVKKSSAPPPPPPALASKPPPVNKRSTSAGEGAGESSSNSEKVKLKPLHWDKVNPNVEHSMVWDKIDKGSFK